MLPLILFGQGINSFWIMGHDAGAGPGFGTTNIDFSQNPTSIYQFDRPMNFWRTNASISDTLGNLQFYSNGIYIANRFDDTLFNGTNFNTGSGTTVWVNDGMPIPQGLLIIPSPSNNNQYYVFSQSVNVYSNHLLPTRLTCSLLDMTLDSGKGGLLWKNVTKVNSPLGVGFQTACKHANGRDWWVTVHKYLTGGIYKLLITPQGISSPVLQNIAHTTDSIDGGQAVYSPNGTKYAIYDVINYLQIFDFDRCTGMFSNPLFLKIQDSASCGGVAFSPNSRYLYVSSTRYIYQFDMQASDILASKTTVAVWDSSYIPSVPFATTFAHMQLAPDGKIYFNSCNGTNILHVINYPDSAGLNCDVCQHCVSLPTYISFTIPNFPNYFLGADSGSVCDTLQLGIPKAELKTQSESVSVFPNPAQDYLQVNYTPNNYVKTLQIIDVNGKVILDRKLAQYSQLASIDASKFLAGIYLCKTIYRDKSVTCKFVKE